MNKRVLIFATTYLPLVGGAEIALKEITDRLPEWQFDLVCAKLKPGLVSTEKIGNVTVHRVGFGVSLDKYVLPILGLFRAINLATYDIAWSLMASYGGFAALLYTWFCPKTKLLLTLQEGDPLEHYAKRIGPFAFLHPLIFMRANAVQAISTFLADWSVRMGFQGKPEVIPNGVDSALFSSVHASNKDSSQTVLITTSRLSLKNGIDDLIRSLQFLPSSFVLRIVGDGEDKQKLENVVTELHVEDRVEFLGYKKHEELPSLLQSADIFVRPSLSEGLGNSFLEAMAAGLPIVGTPVGGIPDFLKDGETGVFCHPRDPESIAKAVKRIQEEPGLREKLIQNGQRLVRETYDWKNIAEQMNQLLKTLSV